jgi:hypothetical protein
MEREALDYSAYWMSSSFLPSTFSFSIMAGILSARLSTNKFIFLTYLFLNALGNLPPAGSINASLAFFKNQFPLKGDPD